MNISSTCNTIVVIGCGGVASYLVRPLTMLLSQCDRQPRVILMDGDTIEERNLDRQWFDREDIGSNKAYALAKCLRHYPEVQAVPEFYTAGSIVAQDARTVFLGCADNHAARRAILNAVDRMEGVAIIGGNEYIEAEAYYYERSMRATPMDPRVYYPAILTDHSGDPTRPRGCTGEAFEAAPQLVLANNSAANHMLWLFWHHLIERPEQGKEYLTEYMPFKTWNLSTKFTTTRACDLITTN